MDINYFTMSIIDTVINHNNVAITYGIKKEFTSPKGHYENKPDFDIVSYSGHQLIENPSKPIVTLPLKFFVKFLQGESQKGFSLKICNQHHLI